MPDLVRAKDPVSGHEFTTSADFAESAGLTVLGDKPATDDFGRVLPAKPNTSKGGTSSASTKKESN